MGFRGFPDGSADKQSTCNAGDTGDVGSSLGLERAAGEGNGNPLQYACLENPMDRGASRATVHRIPKVRHNLVTKHHHRKIVKNNLGNTH